MEQRVLRCVAWFIECTALALVCVLGSFLASYLHACRVIFGFFSVPVLCVPVLGPIPHFFGELATSHGVKSGREMPAACPLFSERFLFSACSLLFRGLGVPIQMFRMFVLFLWKMPLKFDQVCFATECCSG